MFLGIGTLSTLSTSAYKKSTQIEKSYYITSNKYIKSKN